MGEVLLAHLPEDGEHRRLDAVGHEAHAEAAPEEPCPAVLPQNLLRRLGVAHDDFGGLPRRLEYTDASSWRCSRTRTWRKAPAPHKVPLTLTLALTLTLTLTLREMQDGVAAGAAAAGVAAASVAAA